MLKEKKITNKISDSKYITNEIILPKWRRNKFSQNITDGIVNGFVLREMLELVLPWEG